MRQAHPGSPNSPVCRSPQDLPRCFGIRVWLDQTNKPGGHTHTHTHTFPTAPRRCVFWGVRWFTTSWAENEGDIQHGLQVGVRTIGFHFGSGWSMEKGFPLPKKAGITVWSTWTSEEYTKKLQSPLSSWKWIYFWEFPETKIRPSKENKTEWWVCLWSFIYVNTPSIQFGKLYIRSPPPQLPPLIFYRTREKVNHQTSTWRTPLFRCFLVGGFKPNHLKTIMRTSK